MRVRSMSNATGAGSVIRLVRRHRTHMKKSDLILLAALECFSVFFIFRLWRKGGVSVWRRCVWSVILLVPVLGWIFYGFLANHPDNHSDLLTEYYDGTDHWH